MNVLTLGYVGIETPAAEAWESFGPDVLGMPLADPPRGGGVRLRMDDRGHRLALHPGPRHRLAYLGWEMADEAAVGEAFDYLAAAGIPTQSGSDDETADRAVRGLVSFVDYLGVRHELFHGQRTIPNSFQPARRVSGFVTGDHGMGHVALAVPDLGAATRFYLRTLGLRLSDEVRGHADLAFLRCNRRHHSLALAEAPGWRGLLHLMVEVVDLDDVGVTYDLCHSRAVPVARALGRHSNDGSLSFYVRTPSGFDIEYGWGGVHVDEPHSATTFTTGSVWGHQLPDPPLRALAIEEVEMVPAVEPARRPPASRRGGPMDDRTPATATPTRYAAGRRK
jgi:extradiol dioxygenase